MPPSLHDAPDTLRPALDQAERLLATSAVDAEMRARDILRALPGEPRATLILSRALRRTGRADEALAIGETFVSANPTFSPARFEMALALCDLGRVRDAIAVLKDVAGSDPNLPCVWLVLGDQLVRAGDQSGGDAAYANHVRTPGNASLLREAIAAIGRNELARAEYLVRNHLAGWPTDIAAMAMLADVQSRRDELEEAAALLSQCLARAPGFAAARFSRASILAAGRRYDEAIAELDTLLAHDAANPGYRAMRAAALAQSGRTDEAIAGYRSLLNDQPDRVRSWSSLGHALRGAGRQADAIEAYRKSISIAPSFGEGYWGIANLKTARFTPSETRTMQTQLAHKDLAEEDRIHFHFALGKALEDDRQFEDSFRHYERGNALVHAKTPYSHDETLASVARSKAVFTREFFEVRKRTGSTAPDPIFVIGMPRAGSTLIEQILASHSAVEGTAELPNIPTMVRRLMRAGARAVGSHETLAALRPDDLKNLGERYLAETRTQRRRGRPFFVDKMPINFMHVALIELILPRAKIVDARRHPLACCLSAFKQLFVRGNDYAYDLTDLGRFYASYVELMAHWDTVLLARIHRVQHEDLVSDPAREIRRLLDYCELPFEQACLNFHQTERTIRTASSEQVRRPISRDGLEQWRNFEPWLDPLKVALAGDRL